MMNKEYRKSVRCSNYLGIYSRKVFVGGLPPDIDEIGILISFNTFGKLTVDWPGKYENTKYMFPPKGYAFLLFEFENSVHHLIEVCQRHNGHLHYYVSSPSLKNKTIEVKPWKMSTYFLNIPYNVLLHQSQYPVFVGGIPRIFTSEDLAELANNVFGSVSFAAVFVDNIWQYPKGSGFVLFSNPSSYFTAMDRRRVSIEVFNYQKKMKAKCIEFKPLLRDNVPKMYYSLLANLRTFVPSCGN